MNCYWWLNRVKLLISESVLIFNLNMEPLEIHELQSLCFWLLKELIGIKAHVEDSI